MQCKINVSARRSVTAPYTRLRRSPLDSALLAQKKKTTLIVLIICSNQSSFLTGEKCYSWVGCVPLNSAPAPAQPTLC